MSKLLRGVLSRESIPVIAGGAVTMVTFFLSDAAIPNDDGSLWWVRWAMALASLVSYIVGVWCTASVMRPAIDEERDKASALDKALAVERERVERLNEDLDTQRSLRASDKTLSDGRLDSMREAHKKELDALINQHREEEKKLRLHYESTESLLRSELEKSSNLRDVDKTLAQSKVEELLRENGELKAEVARWKAICTTRIENNAATKA